MGRVGLNKGGVAVKLRVGVTDIAFVGAHLAAHQSECTRRNQDCGEILSDVRGRGGGRGRTGGVEGALRMAWPGRQAGIFALLSRATSCPIPPQLRPPYECNSGITTGPHHTVVMGDLNYRIDWAAQVRTWAGRWGGGRVAWEAIGHR